MPINTNNPFRSTLGIADFMTADVATLAGQWNELGRYTLKAGMGLAIGYGAMEGLDAAAGRIYADIKDNGVAPGTATNGKLRIDLESPQKRVIRTIFESRTERLRTTLTDPTKQIPLPYHDAVATEDYSFVLRFMPDAAVTVGKTNSSLLMDVTTFDVSRA